MVIETIQIVRVAGAAINKKTTTGEGDRRERQITGDAGEGGPQELWVCRMECRRAARGVSGPFEVWADCKGCGRATRGSGRAAESLGRSLGVWAGRGECGRTTGGMGERAAGLWVVWAIRKGQVDQHTLKAAFRTRSRHTVARQLLARPVARQGRTCSPTRPNLSVSIPVVCVFDAKNEKRPYLKIFECADEVIKKDSK